MLEPMVVSALNEMKEFSKKKQDGVLNPLKVKLINRLLIQVREEVLQNEATIEYLDLLDDETLPQNSDAVLILGQYEAAMMQFKAKYYGWDGYQHRWYTRENPQK